jgi:PAS domain S-box-containing protein
VTTPLIHPDLATLNALPNPIWAGTPAGHCHFANEALAKLVATPSTELLELNWLRFVPEEEQQPLLFQLEDLSSRLARFRTRIRLQLRNRVRAFRVEARVLGSEQGEEPLVLLSLEDITYTSRASLRRQLHSEQLRICFEHAPVGIAFLNTDLRFVRANPLLCALTSPDAGHLEGQSLQEALEPHMQAHAVADIVSVCKNTLATGTPHTLHRWPAGLSRDDRPNRFTDWEVRRIQTTEGEPVGLLLTLADVSEQKEAEDRLRLLASVLETTTDFVSVHAPDGAILFLNSSARNAAGIAPEALVGGLHYRDIQPKWACKIVSEEGFPTAEQEGSWEGETAFREASGNEIAVSQLVCAHRNPAGEIEFFSCILRDISERKALESMRLEWANRYDTAIKASGQLLFDWLTASGEIKYAGDATRVLGVDINALEGGVPRLLELIHPENRQGFEQETKRVAASREPLSYEFRVANADGRDIFVQARGFSLSQSAEGDGRMIGFFEDVTIAHQFREQQNRSQELLERRVQERTAELALANAVIEDRARQQAAVAQLGARALSALTTEAFLSEAATTIIQTLRVDFCSIRELSADRNFLELKASAGWPAEIQLEQLRGGKESQSGFAILTGEPVLVEDMATENRFEISDSVKKTKCTSSVSVLIAFEDKPFGAMSVFSRPRRIFTQDDINFLQAVANVVAAAVQRQRAEEGLRLAREQAEQANRAKSEFLSRMSHELRTPLNAILGFAQLLKIEEPSGAQAESIGHIVRAGQHLLALINDVLDIARIEAGRLPLTLEPIDAEAVLSSSMELMQPIAARHGVSVELIAPATKHFVRADRLRLKQVALNLVSNSIKYSPRGGVVDIRIRAADDRVRLEVQDRGQGIPQEKREHLFRPFERLGVEEAKIEGTGIGLNLCKGLVDAMHGEIGLDSPAEGGAIFWVELPSVDSGEPAQLRLQPVQPSLPSVSVSKGEFEAKVLYIEGHDFDVHVMERMLQNTAGYRLISAMQADLALELAREYQPNVILLDVEFPDVPFEALIAQMQSEEALRSIPLILVSNEQSDARLGQLPNLRITEALTKPYSRSQLIAAIGRALGR